MKGSRALIPLSAVGPDRGLINICDINSSRYVPGHEVVF